MWPTILVALTVFCNSPSMANPDAKRLYEDLLGNYNKLIRPVGNNTDVLTVRLGLRLSQLINVDEKYQIMTTNVWLRQEWFDYKLMWDPARYGGVEALYVPSQQIWLPDIVLYNNADGHYQVTLMTKATLYYNGKVVWEPPAIYKSSCAIDVEFFPFDEQECHMKFGSWTYDGFQVDLVHFQDEEEYDPDLLNKDYGIDLTEFYPSVEWDVLEVPANKNVQYYPCCPEPFPDIHYYVHMRRKTLFYTVNLIIPCVSISFLTVLVFYLPSDSGEKVTLCISILLSLTVFFLLLSEIIPPTSVVVPLIGKYLLFTMILVTLSICVTVYVLNVHFRTPATHKMSPWVRRVFLHILPCLLLMRRPQVEDNARKVAVRTCNGMEFRESRKHQRRNHRDYTALERVNSHRSNHSENKEGEEEQKEPNRSRPFSGDVLRAMAGIQYIADHLKSEDDEMGVKQDWKFVAMVLDRLFLWIFTIACVVGTCGIILQAPTLYDRRIPLDQQKSRYFLELGHEQEQFTDTL